MNLINNNISPLPFYDDLSFQNHRKDYAFEQIYPLITYRNFLLPFQVVLSSGSSISQVKLFNFITGRSVDVKATMLQNGLKLKTISGYKIIVYPGTLPVNELVHEGQYYLQLRINGYGDIYSEIFTVTNRLDDYAILEYRNYSDFTLKNGLVDFSDNFKFKCYLNTQVGKPEYNFEEQATERLGYSFIESQVSKKVYKFTFIAPEYLCDALRLVRLCEEKTLQSKGNSYDMTTFEMSVDWQDQGDLASVECEFETDTVIANFGGRKHEDVGGDYNNNNYNNDYDIE